jgi:hypothetical protein
VKIGSEMDFRNTEGSGTKYTDLIQIGCLEL